MKQYNKISQQILTRKKCYLALSNTKKKKIPMATKKNYKGLRTTTRPLLQYSREVAAY